MSSKLKVFFTFRGSKGGKEMKPKKKVHNYFDKMKGNMAEKCKGKFQLNFKNIRERSYH